MPCTRATNLEFDKLPICQLWPRDDLKWHTNKVHRRELGTRTLIGVINKIGHAHLLKLPPQLGQDACGALMTWFQVQHAYFKWRNGIGPNNPMIIMIGLNDRADQPADPNAVEPI
jgi:hypothetical protein